MAFFLYLVRHSKAQDHHPSGDFYRELSFEGWRRLEEFLPRLKNQAFQAELYLTSPYIRARQTAWAFFSFFSPKKEAANEINVLSSLVPDGEPYTVTQVLQNHALNGCSSCALFTHNPMAPLLARWFVPENDFYFHAPTTVAVSFPTMPEQGQGRFLWVEHTVE